MSEIRITNPSAFHALRIFIANASAEKGRWNEPQPFAVLQPTQTSNVVLHESRRVSLEPLGADDVTLEISNTGCSPGSKVYRTLRVLTADKAGAKFSDAAHLAFLPPGQSLHVAASAKKRVILQALRS